MEEWQSRLVLESKELENKTSKLQSFIVSKKFQELDIIEQRLLSTQYTAMNRYNNILRERINYYKKQK